MRLLDSRQAASGQPPSGVWTATRNANQSAACWAAERSPSSRYRLATAGSARPHGGVGVCV